MRAIIEHLACYISSHEEALNSWNVATGTAGLALVYEALVPLSSSPWHERAERALAYTLALHAADPFASNEGGLFTGLAGVCRVLSSFAQTYPEYTPLKQHFDCLLYRWIQRQYASSEPRNEGVSFRDYDVISGPAGIASYVLSVVIASPSPDAVQALETLLNHLLALSQPSEHVAGHLRLFISPERAPYHTYAQRYPQGATDCGFAHGLPGVLALLSLCRILSLREHHELAQAIHTLANWLVAHRYEAAYQVRWPLVVPRNAPAVYGGGFWCYGASGIAWALWLAGVALQEQTWQELAIRTMKTIYQDLLECHDQLSPILCHGLAGMVPVVQGLWQTDEAFFASFQQLLTQRLLEQFDASLPSGFQIQRHTQAPIMQHPFLEGAAGIIGALLSIEGKSKLLFPYFLLTECSLP